MVLYGAFLGLAACSSEYQEVKIVVEDFRFSPARVAVKAEQPVHLVVRSQSRELHRFQSALLSRPQVHVVWNDDEKPESLDRGFPLAPGERVELFLTMTPGVYHFRCPIKGHGGMKGMIVVQKAAS